MFDKFHDECGVVAIYGHPEAAKMTYLGLYALQHRGQESAGICTSDGAHIHCRKSMGHVADIFTTRVLDELPGKLAIGHTRYSTAGDTALLNAQPFSVACNKGRVAVAHNGNITNAVELRAELERRGSIFQANSDTEVILHLVAHSSERTLAGALRDALLQIEGAFSLVFLAEDRIIVARDPNGFRPLAVGQMELNGHIGYVFASETCAFDLIGAVYLHDVEPGEMIIVGPEGVTRERYAPERALAQCAFEHVYFSRPDSIVFGRPVQESREMLGRLLAREHPVEADVVVPVPDSGVAAALGYWRGGGAGIFRGVRAAVPAWADPQSLRGPHVHRAVAGDSRFRREVEAQSSAVPAGGQARGAGGRFDRTRHDQPQDRAHDAAGGRARGTFADLVSAHRFALLLWGGYSHEARAHRR
jgi:amidophosphoribosyltransferase